MSMPEAGFRYAATLFEVVTSTAGGPLFDTEEAARDYANRVEARGHNVIAVIKVPLWAKEGTP